LMLTIIIIITTAYLLGSIPFGLLIAKLKGIDIRQHGSGNIGATNVYRTMGSAYGIVVFALDMLKGTLPVILASQYTPNAWLIIAAGGAAAVGHMLPIFLKFKGGKGAATGLGVLLGIAPDVFLLAAVVAFLVIYITKYVSVGSICTAILVTASLYFLNRPPAYIIVAGLITLLLIIRHIPNIKRLLNGTENKIR